MAHERLRFDFTHFEAIGREDLRKIEGLVNERIRENSPVSVRVLPQKEAVNMGAIALFGEKYGEKVRVVSISDYSMELCGGTHVRATGEIGLFKVVGESAVAAGIRRIEAVTGEGACRFVRREEAILEQLSEVLKTDSAGIVERVQRSLSNLKALEKELEKLKSQAMSRQAESSLDAAREIAGVKVLTVRIEEKDPKALRSHGDKMRDRIRSGIVVLGADTGKNAQLLCMVTKDLTGRFSAGRIIKEIAPVIGGRGGGREELAQAGGKDAGKITEALEKAVALIEQMGAQG